jgi:hypothetical protein
MASNPQQQQSSSMSSPPSPLVWFQLLDSATGLPYKGTSADAVSVSPGSFVVQFRDAVKVKYDQPNYLKDIPPGTLLVFKNKTAFDKRNAAFVDGKEEPLDPTESLGLLGSKEDMLVVAVPSSTSSPELVQLEQEIKALENSEEYKTLASKNRAWAHPKPTEQEKGEWQLLKEKLADLKKKEDFYQNAILSTNAHSVKKSDKIRKGYKKDTAIKDERLLLSDVAITMWERFGFTLERNGKPTFGDFKRAAGFKDDDDVIGYFAKRKNELVKEDDIKESLKVKEDDIKESLNEEEWIWLISLNQRVNPLLHSKLNMNRDGSVRLVLEHDVYEDKARVAENIVQKLYGPEKKVDIKDALSDSSTSP